MKITPTKTDWVEMGDRQVRWSSEDGGIVEQRTEKGSTLEVALPILASGGGMIAGIMTRGATGGLIGGAAGLAAGTAGAMALSRGWGDVERAPSPPNYTREQYEWGLEQGGAKNDDGLMGAMAMGGMITGLAGGLAALRMPKALAVAPLTVTAGPLVGAAIGGLAGKLLDD